MAPVSRISYFSYVGRRDLVPRMEVAVPLFMSLIKMNRTQLLDLYAMTSPFTRCTVGVFYEGYCFKEMVDHGIYLNLLKMIRLVPSERKRKWGSPNRAQRSSLSPPDWKYRTRRKRQRAIREHETIDIDEKDLSVQYYPSNLNGPQKKNTLYIPKVPNEKSLMHLSSTRTAYISCNSR
jgi:hypothetical protein